MKNIIYKIVFLSLLLICFVSARAQNDSTIVVFGDTRTTVSGNTHTNNTINKSVINNLMHFKPLAVFHTGDIVFNGLKKSAWIRFEDFCAPIINGSKFYPAYGNHELHSKTVSRDFKLPNNGKWYSVDIVRFHFLIIDNFSDYKVGSEQYQWLENDLKNCSADKFRMVVMHLPVYSSGPHNTQNRKLRKNLVPLFEKYKVNIVFNAHNHCYERAYSNGVYYITTAGGGAPMYPKTKNIAESKLWLQAFHFCMLQIKNNNIELQAIDTNMNVIDEFIIKK